MNDSRNADGRVVGVPRNVDVALLGAWNGCVNQVLGRGVEDIDRRSERAIGFCGLGIARCEGVVDVVTVVEEMR